MVKKYTFLFSYRFTLKYYFILYHTPGVKQVSREGRPAYDPYGLFKLYIYGVRKSIRSSRKRAESCITNIEVKWLLGGATPDFRTISDFRKDNIDCLKKIFREFNKRLCSEVEFGYLSIDGSKFYANNSKNRNFTTHKLDDRITWLNAHAKEYLRLIDEIDNREEDEERAGELTKEQLENKLAEAKERLAKYEGYRRLMEETGASQLSITDADAKLMKNKNGFAIAYNPQTAVDSNTHLIRDFIMTNQVTDHGLIAPTLENIKENNPDKVMEAVADKGYMYEDDMIQCLENGIIPHVIPEDGKDGYDLEIDYVESAVDTDSTKVSDLRDTLHAGVITNAYKDVIEGKSSLKSKCSRKGHYEKRKIVQFTLKPSREKMSNRMCLSEHPFGTIKRTMNAGYFLLKGLKKVEGEFALSCLGYNIERAKNLIGFDRMMQIITTV